MEKPLRKKSGWKKSEVFHLLENIKKTNVKFYKFIKTVTFIEYSILSEFSLCLIFLIIRMADVLHFKELISKVVVFQSGRHGAFNF